MTYITPTDIPDALRKIADRIERGEFGILEESALIIRTDRGIDAFGMGNPQDHETIALLANGIRHVNTTIHDH